MSTQRIRKTNELTETHKLSTRHHPKHYHPFPHDYKSDGSDESSNPVLMDDIINTPLSPLIMSSDPTKWDWKLIRLWLEERDLALMINIFDKAIDGETLIHIDIDTLWRDYNINIRHILNINDKKEALRHCTIKRFIRELSQLKLQAMSRLKELVSTTDHDVFEMKRRIKEFVDKWDCILWIGWYVENNNAKPSKEIVSSELETCISKALIYLQYYDDMERFKAKDLNELLMDFNIHDDCIIWWYIIIGSLKSYPSASLWCIFAAIAKLTPHNIAIQLLQVYQADLTRFDEHQLHKVTQNIVIGSVYPICTSLRIAKWFQDRAQFDIARSDIYNNMAQTYIFAAIDHLKRFQSDHLATVVLETSSDIDGGLSALEMALQYSLKTFVASSRIERVVTSIMNDWEFLRPKNREEAFEINPVSISLVWNLMFKKEFYLTPLGTFITTMVLYFAYLALFTYLSFEEFEVYDEFSESEIIFWLFNMGYVGFELQAMASEGLSSYLSLRENYFDAFISCLFVASISIRIWGTKHPKPCANPPINDCSTDIINTLFFILWACATIALWLRIVIFCVFSTNLGPMVQMIFRMMEDIVTFFEIMVILFAGFTFALASLMGDIHGDFRKPHNAALSLFMAALGEFDFDDFDDFGANANQVLIVAAHFFILLYLVIASLVLLNILIAMMAKTFDNIHESSTTAIIFSRFELAHDKSDAPSYMPPPLNIFVTAFVVLFYCVEYTLNFVRECICKKEHYDLMLPLMPSWMRHRKLEIDEQITYNECQRHWRIITNQGEKKCRMLQYNQSNMKHLVAFFDDDESTEIHVSIQNKIEKRKQFWLDLFELKDQGLINFKQFRSIRVTQKWVRDAFHDGYKEDGPYWICAFCRRFVKKSGISIKRLGRELNVSAVEMALIHKMEPEICTHCFRRRHHIKRRQLIWEVLAIWMFYIFVWWFLILLVFLGMLLFHRSEIKKPWRKFRRFLAEQLETSESGIVHQAMAANADDNNFCYYHYKDSKLIENMNKDSDEHKLFDPQQENKVWGFLHRAKNEIDPDILYERITNHILELSTEKQLTKFKFFDECIRLREIDADKVWSYYFKPLAVAIFMQIQFTAKDEIPLHLFAKFPFKVTEGCKDDFQQFWSDKDRHGSIEDCSKSDLVRLLEDTTLLNCRNKEERVSILDGVESHKRYDKDKIFYKFMAYLHDVQSLFQNNRKLNNMIRDASVAIKERGIDTKIKRDQLPFLFEDITDPITAIPFFNTLSTDREDTDLWSIRNILMTILYLKNTVKHHMVSGHSRIYVDKDKLFEMVKELHPDCIMKDTAISSDQQKQISVMQRIMNDDDGDDDDEKYMKCLSQPPAALDLGRLFSSGELSRDVETEKQRMEVFYKQQITEKALKTQIDSIFEKLKRRRANKTTFEIIKQYRSKLMQDESIKYILEQLCRICAFFPAKMSENCTFELFQTLLCDEQFMHFSGSYMIDPETRPKAMKDSEYLKEFYDELEIVYNATLKMVLREQSNNNYFDDTDMRVLDVLSIVLLFHRICESLQCQLEFESNRFVVSLEQFVKFVDPNCISKVSHPIETDRNHISIERIEHKEVSELSDDDESEDDGKWGIHQTDKAKLAKNIFQSVLDSQQHFITLGQVMQTINILIGDVHAMKCGDLTRIVNHLSNRMKHDDKRCNDKLRNISYDDDDEKGAESRRKRRKRRNKYEKNPKLKFFHLDFDKWNRFAMKISKDCCADKPTYNLEQQNVQNVILRNVNIFILKKSKHDGNIYDYDEESKFQWQTMQNMRLTRRKSHLKNPKIHVFDEILSFNNHCISLQQIFEFSVKFAYFLKQNDKIDVMMKEYEDTKKKDDPNEWNEQGWYKKEWRHFEDFKQQYFTKTTQGNESFLAEILWLFDYSMTKKDLCHKIDLFYPGGTMVLRIHDFMRSTEKVTGIYTLRAEEFSLSYSITLNINEAATNKLFYIIRHKERSLSYKQFHRYFKFLLIMKYRVQFAIDKSEKREDKTISRDALQNELGISNHDEAQWLFNKVEKYHDKKLGWKQITQYLQKTLSVRTNIRDFFDDKKRDEDYQDNSAEIMVNIENRQIMILDKIKNIKKSKDIDSLKKIFIKYATNQKLIYEQFAKVVIGVIGIDIIKEHHLKDVWNHLIFKQNTELNRNNHQDDRKEEWLGIDFLMSHIQQNVENYCILTTKQILLLAFVQFIFNASDDNENNINVIFDEIQSTQRQFSKENKMLLREIKSLKNRNNSMNRATSINPTPLTD